MNLSFVPQSWGQGDIMHYLDVGHAASEARAAYRWELEKKEREANKKIIELQSNAAPPLAAESNQTAQTSTELKSATTESVLPESLQFAYREIQDKIFTPLKELSDFLRSYAAFVALGCFTVLIATMGIVFAPNLSEFHTKMKALDNATGWSLSELLPAQKSQDAVIVSKIDIDTPEINLVDELESPEIEVDPLATLDADIDPNETPLVAYALISGTIGLMSCELDYAETLSETNGFAELTPP